MFHNSFLCGKRYWSVLQARIKNNCSNLNQDLQCNINHLCNNPACSCGFLCVVLFLCFFSLFSVAAALLGEERANLSSFRTFVRFALVWFFSVSSSSWCLGRAAVCNSGTPWTFLLPLFIMEDADHFFLKLFQLDQCAHCTVSCNPKLPIFGKLKTSSSKTINWQFKRILLQYTFIAV